jgi:nicotinate dehydrogenase subunit A
MGRCTSSRWTDGAIAQVTGLHTTREESRIAGLPGLTLFWSAYLMETEFRLIVNGAERSVTCEPDTPLLDVLRHDLGLAGPKFGCGMGLCGACLVLIGDRARSSCDLPVSAVDGRVITVEGLPDGGRLHPVQQAFIDEQAAQCGYCTSGMVMAAAG